MAREKVNENPELEKVSASVKGKSEAAGYYERIQLGGMAQKMFTSCKKKSRQMCFLRLKRQRKQQKQMSRRAKRCFKRFFLN